MVGSGQAGEDVLAGRGYRNEGTGVRGRVGRFETEWWRRHAQRGWWGRGQNSFLLPGIFQTTIGTTGGGRGVIQVEASQIHFGTYNIRNVWNRRLESALRVMSQANVGLGIFQEVEVTVGIYTW